MKQELFCNEEACKKCRKSLEEKKEDALLHCLECEKAVEMNKIIKNTILNND